MTPEDRAEVERIAGPPMWFALLFTMLIATVIFCVGMILQEASRITALEAQVKELKEKP